MRNISAGDKYSAFEVAQLRKVQRDLCAYCCISLHGAGHVDHVTSVAKGGTNEFKNLVLACSQCNREKHAKTGHEYFEWRASRKLPVLRRAYAYKLLYGSGRVSAA